MTRRCFFLRNPFARQSLECDLGIARSGCQRERWCAGSRARDGSRGDAARTAVFDRSFAQESVAMLPVQKTSKARKRKRRSHHALKPIHYVTCPQCSNAKLPHAACENCGYVNPKLALQVDQETP